MEADFCVERKCVMYTTAKLTKVENSQRITRERHFDFYFELQRGVLLSLKAEGLLNEIQYRHAEAALKEQRSMVIRSGAEGGSAS